MRYGHLLNILNMTAIIVNKQYHQPTSIGFTPPPCYSPAIGLHFVKEPGIRSALGLPIPPLGVGGVFPDLNEIREKGGVRPEAGNF